LHFWFITLVHDATNDVQNVQNLIKVTPVHGTVSLWYKETFGCPWFWSWVYYWLWIWFQVLVLVLEHKVLDNITGYKLS